jgi:hypothetical protein
MFVFRFFGLQKRKKGERATEKRIIQHKKMAKSESYNRKKTNRKRLQRPAKQEEGMLFFCAREFVQRQKRTNNEPRPSILLTSIRRKPALLSRSIAWILYRCSLRLLPARF